MQSHGGARCGEKLGVPQVLADQAWLRVTLAPGPPAALLRLEANGIELQVRFNSRSRGMIESYGDMQVRLVLCLNGSCETLEARPALSCIVPCAFGVLHITDGLWLRCRRRRDPKARAPADVMSGSWR